jgi:hypothetical protein
VQINIYVPEQDANINSNPTITFDVNKSTPSDINGESIIIDLNGTASTDFGYLTDCDEYSGSFHCEYLETGLAQDEDHNISFRAANDANQWSDWIERIVHYDVTAPTITSVTATKSGSDVIVSYDGTDAYTGIEIFYVRESTETWIANGTSKTYTFAGHASADHIYQVKAKDYADNNSLVSQATYTAPAAVTPTPTAPVTPGGGAGGLPPVEEGIFDLQIVRVDDPVEVGERFDFTYKVENGTRDGDNVYIEYWLEQDGQSIVSGSETIYISSGEQIEISEDLLLLEEMSGPYDFHITMSRAGEEIVTRQKSTRMMLGAPLELELEITSLTPGEEEKPTEFSFFIGSNKDETLPILVEERLFMEGKIVWEKKQTVAITAFGRFLEQIYDLEPGNYRLEVSIFYDELTKRDEWEFERKRKPVIPPGMELPPEVESIVIFFLNLWPWILLLILIAIAIIVWERWRRKKKRGTSLQTTFR